MPIRLTNRGAVPLPPVAPGAAEVRMPWGPPEYPRTRVTGITYQGPGAAARVWNLLPDGEPGARLLEQWEGYGALKPTAFTSSSPLVDGQRLRGMRFEARHLTLPVILEDDRGGRWMQNTWEEWWAAWSYREHGTLAVTVDGRARSLRVRLDEPLMETGYDPFEQGRAQVVVGAIADDPHWRGDPERVGFGIAAFNDTMFDTAGTGYVFNITGGHTYESSAINNPGDLPVYPEWTVRAPWTSVTLGLGSQVITYPVPSSSATDVLTVTHQGGSPVVWLDRGDGVRIDVIDRLTSWGFASVPPGVDVPLRVEMDGLGAVTVELTPRYFAPY